MVITPTVVLVFAGGTKKKKKKIVVTVNQNLQQLPVLAQPT